MARNALLVMLATSLAVQSGEMKDKLREQFEQTCESSKFSGVATLTVNNKLVFSAACGFADARRNVRNSEETRFRIASITKEFTAAAVLLLHEDRKLLLTDPIGKYLRGLPESWRPATIHQLLTHTSGVPIYTASPTSQAFPSANPLTGGTPQLFVCCCR